MFECADSNFLIVDILSVAVVFGIELNEGIVEGTDALPLCGIDALVVQNFAFMACSPSPPSEPSKNDDESTSTPQNSFIVQLERCRS